MIIPPNPTDAANLAAAVVAGQTRHPTFRLLADWNRNGLYNHALSDLTPWVTRVGTDRVTEGGLPEEATLVEGHTAAELTAALGGDRGGGAAALDTFGPYRTGSGLAGLPWANTPVTLDIGFAGTVWTRVFTGRVRKIQPSSSDRTVTLTVLDDTDRLRAPITMPAHAMHFGDVIASGHKLSINSQAILDFVLRKNGIYASPPAHPQAQISCTGHGWLAAEAGRSAVPRGVAAVISGDHWYIDDGPFGMLAVRGVWDSNGLYQEFYARETFNPIGGSGIGIAAWVRVGNDMGVTAGTKDLFEVIPLVSQTAWKYQLYITHTGSLGGVIDINGVNSGFAQPISTATAWMYVGIHFQHNNDGTTTIRYRQNGATTQGTITTPDLTSTVAPFCQATAWTWRDWASFQVWYSHAPPTGSWPGETHTPQATIGKGLGWLTHLPDVVERESLAVIRDVVGAEFGSFGFDETGTPVFANRDTATDPNTVDKTITADTDLLDLAAGVDVDTIRNAVTAETSMAFLHYPRVIAESREATLWQTPPGITEWEVDLPYGAIGTTTITLPRVASASWNDTVTNGYVSVRADSPTTEITSGLLVAFSMARDRVAVLKVWNYTAWTVRFATTSGSPALRAEGWALDAEPPHLVTARADGSITTYGERTYKIPADDWRQIYTTVQDLAGGLVGTLANPIPVIPTVPILGDPRVQTGDVVRITDPQGQGAFRAYVLGVSHRLDRDGDYTTDLAVRPVAPPGTGLLDDNELGVLDSTLILAP